MTNKDPVKRLAGDKQVTPASGLSVPGMAFYRLTDRDGERPTDRDPPSQSVAIIVDSPDRLLKGKQAMRAVAERTTDAAALAGATAFLISRAKDVIGSRDDVRPAHAEQADRAGVAPPAIRDGTLTYWAYRVGGMRPAEIYRVRLDLTAFEVEEVALAELGAPATSGQDEKLAQFNQWLASGDEITREMALDGFVSECAKPWAATGLAEVARTHNSELTRRQAVQRIPRCKGPKSIALLLDILASDNSSDVRSFAALSLGQIGDASARAGLDRARTSDADDSVKRAAANALKQLK